MARKATGTIERRGGKLFAKVTLPDGRRARFPLPAALSDARARETAAAIAERLASGAIEIPPPKRAKRGGVAEAPGKSVAGWCSRWTADRARRGLSSAADDTSRLRTHVLPVIGALDMAEVTRADLEAVVAALDAKVQARKLHWKTAKNAWGLVTKAFKDAASSKNPSLRVRHDNPAIGVAAPDKGASRGKTFLYPTELDALIQSSRLPFRWRRLFAVATYLYVRLGELRALRWEDFDFERGTVYVHRAYAKSGEVKSTKSGHTRRVALEPALLPLLRAMRDEDPRPDDAEAFDVPPVEYLSSRLRKYLRWVGVTRAELFVTDATRKNLTFHDLRATGITWLAVRGEEPLRIMQRAGHLQFATTQIYVRTAESLAGAFGAPFGPLDVLMNRPVFRPTEESEEKKAMKQRPQRDSNTNEGNDLPRNVGSDGLEGGDRAPSNPSKSRRGTIGRDACPLCVLLPPSGAPANDRIVAPDLTPPGEAWLCGVHTADIFRSAA